VESRFSSSSSMRGVACFDCGADGGSEGGRESLAPINPTRPEGGAESGKGGGRSSISPPPNIPSLRPVSIPSSTPSPNPVLDRSLIAGGKSGGSSSSSASSAGSGGRSGKGSDLGRGGGTARLGNKGGLILNGCRMVVDDCMVAIVIGLATERPLPGGMVITAGD